MRPTQSSRLAPPRFPVLSSRVALATLPLLAWGLGACSRSSGPEAAPGAIAKEIVVGHYHACAIYEDTTAGCWSLAPANTMQTARRVPKLRGLTAIAIASVHACAIVTSGAVMCWSYVDKDMTTPGDAMAIEELPAMRSLQTSRWSAAMTGVTRAGTTLYWSTRPSRTWFGDPQMATSTPTNEPAAWTSMTDFDSANDEKSRCTLMGTRAECTTWDGASLLVRL